MKFRILFLLTSFFYTTGSFAMFCPNGFNQINEGDTIEQVQAQCGSPASAKRFVDERNQPQEWTYVLPIMPPPNTLGSNPGTQKITYDFVDGKLVNMTNNGIGVGSSPACGTANIQVGSSIDDVKNSCGKPNEIQKTNMVGPSGQNPPPNQITQWNYGGSTPATLVFENGKLKERQ